MNNNKYLISVIVPVYNAEQYLVRCLDSIAGQTYSNLEIICVNDGSQDNSGKILDEYAERDKRFRIIHQANAGQAAARNIALDCATGDLIANVDSDDYLELHAYERVIEHFDDDIDMVWFGNHVVGDLDEKHMNRQRTFYRIKQEGKMKLDKLPVSDMSGAVWNKVVRRDILEKYYLRYPRGVIFEDLCFFAKLVPVLGNVYFLPDKLYFYWQRADSTMGVARSKSSDKSKDVIKIIQPTYEFYSAHNLFKTHRALYDTFFGKFYRLAHLFLPSELKTDLLREAYELVQKYGGGSPTDRNRLLVKTMKVLYPPRTHVIKFLGIKLFQDQRTWNRVIRRVLGIKVYERFITRQATYRKTLFCKNMPNRKEYCFFGIPIFTIVKDATRARKLFGITIRKKKVAPAPVMTAKLTYKIAARRLGGKKIIVTGGGRGLGYDMAKKFVAEGADVLIVGRNAELLEKKAAILGCKYMALDVQDVAGFDSFMEKAEEMLGGLDCLVNNAGISKHERTLRDVTLVGFDAQFSTNLRGSYFLAQSFIKHVKSKGRTNCNILFISSERGLFVDDIPYGLTKVAINNLVKGLATRLQPMGIRVNGIAPGITASEMTGYSTEGNLYCAYNASKRVFMPEEVSEAACFALEDSSACMTGQIIACDQGRAIHPHWRRV